jgi:hypothetical protein
VTSVEALPTLSNRDDDGLPSAAPLPGDTDRSGRVTADVVLRWTVVPSGVPGDSVGPTGVLRCTVVALGVLGDPVGRPGVLRCTVVALGVLGDAVVEAGAAAPPVAVPAP